MPIPSSLDATATAPAFDIVVLATSAGGLHALHAVLDVLPADFPAPVLVVQHLGRYGSALAGLLGARCALPVGWVTDDTRLRPGHVLVCPPQRSVEVAADGMCRIGPGVARAPERPIDTLLDSIAASYGARALAVVLTGMGRDGAEGVRALARVGATVLAQSEDSSEYVSMPRAAAASGGVDLVLALEEIGTVVRDVVAGGVLPRARAEIAAAVALFSGHGATRVGPLLVARAWERSPLGPVTTWPAALRAAVRGALGSHVPTVVTWGEGPIVHLANDAAIGVLVARAATCVADVHLGWLVPALGAECARVRTSGIATLLDGTRARRHARNAAPDAALTISCSRVLEDESGPQSLARSGDESPTHPTSGGLLTVATVAPLGAPPRATP